jgi:hypothetical protein
MLFDLPGFIHRSFTDQTLLAIMSDRDQSLHNFHIAQTYTLAFFNKYLKGDTKTLLDTGETVDSLVKLESAQHGQKTRQGVTSEFPMTRYSKTRKTRARRGCRALVFC